jgi:cytochrome b6-f complex iron-sulfur subunit
MPDSKPARSHLLVKPKESGFPILLRKRADSSYDAVLLRCTHQGCEVGIEGQGLACPCHGSEFSLEGKVTRGPAEKNLHSFKITEDDEHVYIWLR